MSTGSQSMDLLMQMQPRSAGAEYDERSRKAAQPLDAGARVERPALPPLPSPAGLLGAGMDPAAASGGVEAAAVRPLAGDRAAAGAPRHSPPDAGDDGKIRLPVGFVRFLREHREQVVVGSVLVLALVWGGSIVRANRRRR
jgi:hypothetical protein